MARRRLEIIITGNSRDAERAMGRVEGRADKMSGKLAKAGAAVAGAFAAAGAVSVFGSMIEEAREAAKVGRLTDAVIKSTGGAAKVSAGQVSDLAEALSKKSGVDDEAIQSGSNLLLTFTKVRDELGKGNDIFSQATTLALDMSTAMGTDMTTASMQLGKALNDPIKGMGTLGKAGVQFSIDQKEQIKTMVAAGDVLGAQKIILGELETQFGGAAAAAADPIQKLGVMWGNFLEGVGAKILPWVEDISSGIGERMPAMMERASGFVEDLTEKVAGLATDGWNLIEPAVMDVVRAFQNLATFGTELYESLRPIGEVLLLIGGAAIVGGVTVLAQGLESVSGFLADHADQVMMAVTAYGAWRLVMFAPGIWAGITAGVAALSAAFDKVALSAYDAAGGVSALQLAAGGIAAVAVVAYLVYDAFKDARQATKEWGDSLDDDLDFTKISTFEDRFAAVQERESAASAKISTDGGFFGTLTLAAKGAVDVIPGVSTGVLQAASDVEEADRRFQEAGGFEDLREGLNVLYDDLGLTRTEVLRFADELDFGEAEVRTSRAAFLIRRHMKGMAEEAGYQGPRIQDAMMLPPEVLEEQEAAWQQLSDSVTSSWGSALDAVTGLGSFENLTGDNITGWYEMQRVNAENFASNITKAFQLGYDPQLISRLLQAGPAEAAPIVQGLLDNHSANLLWTVNAGEQAMADLSEKAVMMARLTHLATISETSAMVNDLGEAMAIQNAIADAGAHATVQSIASQLQMGVGEVARITDEYGIEIQGGTAVMQYVAAAGAGMTVQALAEELGLGVDKVRWIAASYGVALENAINPVLRSVGKPTVHSVVGAGHVQRNAGGPIPGPNVDKDVVPAMLTPGEFVLNKDASKSLGMGALNFMNQTGRLPGYNSGGEVLLAAGRMLQGAGARVSEHPAFGGVGGGHAPGGYHYRNSSGTGGDAFDANKGAGTSSSEMAFFDQWAPKIAAMGLRVLWRVAGHFNHLHADLGKGGYGMGGSGNYSHFAPMPKPPSIGGWPLAQGGEGAMNLAYMAATEFANSSYGASVGPGGSNSAVRSMVQQMAAQRGWVGGEWSALDRLVQKESSWNPNAQNPTSTAYGLFQFLNSTWGAYGSKTSNPALQAKYGFQYIADRYGSPSKALAFHLRNNWYNDGGEVTAHANTFDSGGTLARGYNLVRNNTGRPEHLVPAGRGQTIVNVYVEGSVTSERDLVDVVVDGLNRKQRNSPTPVLPGVSG